MRRLIAACLGICLLAAAGCGRKGPESVEDLAAALKEHGVAYEVTETAALPGIKNEGLFLKGEGLDVGIYRIERERDMKLALAAAAIGAAGQAQVEGAAPIKPYVKAPFLVIVRSEPQEGSVKAAFEQAFPD